MRTIRWGIIGCGDVTEVKSGPACQKANHSQLVAVMLSRLLDSSTRSRCYRPPSDIVLTRA